MPAKRRAAYRADTTSEEGNAASVSAAVAVPRSSLAGGSAVGLARHGAVDNGHVNAGLLPHIAILKDTADAAATTGAEERNKRNK